MKKEELVIRLNEVFEKEFTTMDEVEDFLSDKFVDYLDEFTDGQVAFNELDDKIGGDLLMNNFVYSLSTGGEWDIIPLENVAPEILKGILNKLGFKPETTIDQVCTRVNNLLMKTISNVGCNVKTAFQLELEDAPDLDKIVQVFIPEGNPVIEYFDYEKFREQLTIK